MPLNLSLYLVTDSTPAILKGRDLCTVVEEALKGGVTIVQYRDKKSDTGEQIQTAKKLHQITQKYGVPLLINDRVDVALAAGVEGVHLGQDDMAIEQAKQLLPKDAIIGITAASIEEAQKAIDAGADYLGIGTMFATPTKTNTKHIIGTAGTQAILDAISDTGRSVGTVSIGGINLSNVQRVLYQSRAPRKELDGVAIVSAIIAADDPKAAAAEFVKRIATPPPFVRAPAAPQIREVAALQEEVPKIVQKVVQAHPLVHNMINFVVANFVANVALSMGASPIMAPHGDEAVDLAQFDGGLVVNMGTLTSESVPNYLKAIKAYNERGNPVVYDPVGAAATHIRRGAVKQLMAGGYFDLIKGNEGEIRQVFGSSGVTQRGVDSGPSSLDGQAKALLARDLARREHNLVLLTGAVDYLSDGERVIAVENGHELLGQVTGTGCAVGTVSGCFLTGHPSDRLLAVLSGILMYEIAAENAASKEYVRGPGSFVPAFLDELYAIRQAALKGDHSWFTGRAKIQVIDL
ncbi:Hydroxyethylthiazole kinase family-domain-containing protein [Aspergillus novoparasiticus]|uniref:Hydroxyethylthiazole kinase family-domain-containing protein n=1 Tax=Aspergillus novoparasiticus TaxID=986946 RepID=A0A5N6ETD9_9EURO|nr:Hydroxyethylthiazole kinase family-domain-containing protein [Aspergillus novoparasiticus]